MVDENTVNEGESHAPSDDVLEPTAGKGIPSYRPWDWIAGYGLAFFIAFLMFHYAETMYDLAK